MQDTKDQGKSSKASTVAVCMFVMVCLSTARGCAGSSNTGKTHTHTPELLREAVGCQGYQHPTSETVSIKLLLSVCECVHAGARRSRDID